jgi:hypothetical protein
MSIRAVRSPRAVTALALFALVGGSPGQPVALRKVAEATPVLRPGGRIWIEGGSNLHDWSCEAAEFASDVRVDRVSRDTRPTRVEKAKVTVVVAAIECGKSKMNENLRKALNAAAFPEITFELADAVILPAEVPGLIEVLARGYLMVAGTEREIEIRVTAADTGDGALRIQGRVGFLMTDFGVEPPTAMLGLLKTADPVTVLFDVTAEYAELQSGRMEAPRGGATTG